MPAFLSFFDGGKPGRRTTLSSKSLCTNVGKRTVARVLPLGTGAVSTATYLLGVVPVAGKVLGIQFVGQAAVTGTSITAEVLVRSADGNSTTTLQASATDVKITASTDETVLAATLTATTANLTLTANAVLEVMITASSITAGPGDVIVQVVYLPAEQTRSAGTNGFEIGADLL